MDLSVVWLDNDSVFIKDQATKIQRVISMITGSSTVVIKDLDDPKNHELQVIQDLLIQARLEDG